MLKIKNKTTVSLFFLYFCKYIAKSYFIKNYLMKTKLLPLVAMAWTCATSMQAQQITVSPLPQEITWGSKAFDKGFSYTLTGESDADADAVRVLKSGLTAGSGSNVNIVIGERGDAAVAAYETDIPNKKEGYYLKVEPGKVIIAGNDESGTFYGVQTFLQIASQPEVMSATVTDYPDVTDRGVIEGFYGNWWSQEDRIRQFEFYGKNKMNVYIYAPKDDPYHRGKWRDPYPASEAAKLKELVAKAKENKVQFVWSIHPGNDIQWNETDMQKVLNKFELMYDIGVRAFGLLFDDISGTEQSRADKQAELINYVTDNFIKKYPELPPIIFCPTQYNRSWSSGTYLDVLGENAYKEARIMWTGNSVVDMINKSDMDWINAKLQRNAYIWLNYPTNDYCIDRMLMGPTYGNDKNIAEQLSGFTANPSEYAEASKVSLYSIADYTWNMTDYDENASWERAIKYLMPDHAEAFKVFCENNIDLGSTSHGLRRKDESKRFAEAIEVFEKATVNGLNQEAFDNIKPMFDEFVNSCEELLDPQVQENDPLILCVDNLVAVGVVVHADHPFLSLRVDVILVGHECRIAASAHVGQVFAVVFDIVFSIVQQHSREVLPSFAVEFLVFGDQQIGVLFHERSHHFGCYGRVRAFDGSLEVA